jgi:CubicO group peptidase (beta-lactamase class C family)
MTLNRRQFLAGGAVAAASVPFFATLPLPKTTGEALKAIRAMGERYMREMNAPAMVLSIVSRDMIPLTSWFGAAKPEQLFHIGSISKSFTAIALLQLRDEGKLDLHQPVVRYLPWLRIEPRTITTHHLLSHSSGLPSWAPVFLSDPDAVHTAGFTPGAHYHYCNLGYAILGHLVEALDGKSYHESIRTRIFAPLEMKESVAYIAPELRERTIESHVAYRDDRPYARYGKLAAAPQIIFDNAAGSISSNAQDMTAYLRMLVNRGAPLLKESTFAEMTTRHIRLDEKSEAGYGYGLFIDRIDDHPVIRHTGGMVSFMSAMHVDLEDGIGAFASINAQQGYRPNPVSTFAIRAIRAAKANKPMPELPPANPPAKIADAKDLAGVYTAADGAKIEFVAEGEKLFLLHGKERLPVELASGAPYAQHPEFDRFAFVFERESGDSGKAVSVGHGSRWWMHERYRGATAFDVPQAWHAYAGHYRNEDPWVGSLRIVLRQGKLWMNGTDPLRPVDEVTFRAAVPEHNPEWIRFLAVANGKSQHIKVSGYDLWRVAVP